MACSHARATLLLAALALMVCAIPALGRELRALPAEAAPPPLSGDYGMVIDGAPSGEPLPAPTTIAVEWGFPSALNPPLESFPEMMAKVGDTATFTWQGFHGVWRIPDGACPMSFTAAPPTMEEVSAASDGGSASVIFDTPGTYWYACQVGSHCSSGMLIKFTVA